jgi:hypothetical protein
MSRAPAHASRTLPRIAAAALRLSLVCGSLLLPAGCTTEPRVEKPRHVERVTPDKGEVGEIHLFGVPVALDVEGKPGLNVLAVKVFASVAGGSQGITVHGGRLEILMFDRSAEGLNPSLEKPSQVWTYEAAGLPEFKMQSLMGVGYQFALKLGDKRPQDKAVAVVARYISPGGIKLYSGATTISIVTK